MGSPIKKLIIVIIIMVLLSMSSFIKGDIKDIQMIAQVDGIDIGVTFNPTGIGLIDDNNKHTILADEGKRFVDIAIGDIDTDGNDEILVLIGDRSGDYGDQIRIYSFDLQRGGLREMYRNNLKAINPWMIEKCDIDNDGEIEIFIGVNKGTFYYTEVDNRPFFFNFIDGGLVKKWTGSKVRRPFVDVYFGDFIGNGSDDFIVIEKTERGGYSIAVYYWFGFGFILQAESDVYQAIDRVDVVSINNKVYIEAQIKEGNKGRIIYLESVGEKSQEGVYRLIEGRLKDE